MSVGRRVLVPIANPASVTPLLALATRLCEPDGRVVPVTVVGDRTDPEEVARAEAGIAEAEQVVRDRGGHAHGRVVASDHPVEGVLAAIREEQATLVVMGWKGRSSTSDVFGRLIDSVVGRSSVPLAVVRLGAADVERVLLPVSPDHLLPGGDRGLGLAAELAGRLATGTGEPTTVLRTGDAGAALPPTVHRLGDRVHHDPRRIHQAVGAAARPQDLVVAAVAPTVSGLRAATTHLAWAAPDATLLVAVDVGPTERGIVEAVDAAGRPAPRREEPVADAVRIVVTVALPDDVAVGPEELERVLRGAGRTEQVMAWWPGVDTRPHVRATVAVRAPTANAALSRVMIALHEAPEFRGTEITYDLDHTTQGVAVDVDEVTVDHATDDLASSAVDPTPGH